MRILYFDCFSGISGDMTLGALINCGIDPEEFKRQLDKLQIEGYEIKIANAMKNGISGTDVDVILKDREYIHDHDGHSHHHHRNLGDIEHILDHSSLNEKVKSISKKIFRKLAYAEAKIHGKTVEEVHFHEVGAVDSIVDIVGTAICIDMLKIDRFAASPVNTGMGFVKCQHGIIPVPGPAALELLKGVPVYSTDTNTELVTPTGAAIISSLCESFGPIPAMVVESIGYGAGKKELEIPNYLRVIIGEDRRKEDDVYMMECNIDDMNAEFYDHVMKRLFDEGALDVFMTSIMMKKNRPAVKLSLLARLADTDKLSNIIFSETSTIGIRKYPVSRETLKREIISVSTIYGHVRIKIAYCDGKCVNYAPEYEDVKALSQSTGMPVKEIYNEAIKEVLMHNLHKAELAQDGVI